MNEQLLAALNGGLKEGLEGRQVKRYFRACFYGPPGSGKTTLATRICEVLGGRTLLLYTDSTWVAIDKPPAVNTNIDPSPYGGFSQLHGIVEARNEGIQPWAGYSNLIIDAIGGGVDDTRRELTKHVRFKGENTPVSNPQKIEITLPSQTHYMVVMDKFAEAMQKLRGTDLNIIYLAHLREPSEADRDKKRFAIRPDLPYATYLKLSRESQLVGWTHKERQGGKRLVQFEGTTNEEAKSQIVGIEETTYDQNDIPNLVRIWKETVNG